MSQGQFPRSRFLDEGRKQLSDALGKVVEDQLKQDEENQKMAGGKLVIREKPVEYPAPPLYVPPEFPG